MPEPPDFDQIARNMLTPIASERRPEIAGMIAEIAEQLRQTWNNRGAADLEALEPIIDKLGDTMDPDNARVFVGGRIRALDRPHKP
jgi:hypothetical protein